MRFPRFLRRSIRLKVTVLVIASTFAALSLSALGLGYYTVQDYHKRKLADVRTLAEIVARAAAPALSFNDSVEAKRDLELLRARPGVEQAALYTPDGRLFVAVSIVGEVTAPPSLPHPPGHRIHGDYITVVHPIVEDGQHVGTLVLKALYEVNRRLVAYMTILGAVMAFALVAAGVLSSWLQRAITDPILRLAQAAGNVIERRDFSVRAGKMTDDDGILADAMNRMLADLEREIAERRNAEESLRVVDRRKDEFLATLAHELRNPLAPIRNAIHLMQTNTHDPQVLEGARAIIDRQVTQLVRLIDDLLDVSRITTGKLTLRRERMEVRRVAMAAIEAIEPSAQKHGHRLQYRLPPSGVMIDADPARLEQVFLNLLNNAVKFTKPPGEIDFSVEVVDGEMIAKVLDNGIGIPSDMLERIFEMFTQVDRRLDRAATGLGVGLSISRTLVELHGGTVQARSAGPDRGAEFIVRLPAGAPESVPSAAQPNPTVPAGNRLRILVVDDNVDFADSLGLMLMTLGHDVRVEHDGSAGLAAAEAFRPEIALLDIGMPKLDGFELAKRLRVLPGTASSHLVAVSGWGEVADRQRSREAGFDEHIVKPLEFEQLLRLLVRLKSEPSPGRTEGHSTTST